MLDIKHYHTPSQGLSQNPDIEKALDSQGEGLAVLVLSRNAIASHDRIRARQQVELSRTFHYHPPKQAFLFYKMY